MSEKKINWEKEPDETIVCYCTGVDKGTIVGAILEGANSLKDIINQTGAGLGNQCKELNPKGVCCHPDIKAILSIYSDESEEGCSSCGCCG